MKATKIISSYVKRHKRLPKLSKFKTASDTLKFLKFHSPEFKRHLKKLKMNKNKEEEGQNIVDSTLDIQTLNFLSKLEKSEKDHAQSKFDFFFYTKALKTFISNKENVNLILIIFFIFIVY